MIDEATLKKACEAIRKEAASRKAISKDLSAAGMAESGAVQRNRAAGLGEALVILEAFLGKEAVGA